MKSEILKYLRETEGYISGQELCDKFSVSRTAIWKVIGQLKDEGYEIEAIRNKGYHLMESPDIMNKATIESHIFSKTMGREVVYYSEVDSTNIQAKLLGEKGSVEGTLVISDMQSKGKGRRGNSWESPAGSNIFMSLLIRPKFEPVKAPMLTLVMAYSIAKVLNESEEMEVQIKWPNDIVLNKKKICGILTEMSTEIDYINYVVIGVGLNCNIEEFPAELAEIGTSIKKETGTMVLRAELIGEIMNEFEAQYENFCREESLSYIREEYNQLLVNKNQSVKVLDPKGTFEATALGIDQTGALLVEREGGVCEAIFAGEVSVRGMYGYV